MDQYLPTGNEMISLPKLNAATAGIETFTFLSMRLKGLVDVRGGADCPLFQPLIFAQWRRDEADRPLLAQRSALDPQAHRPRRDAHVYHDGSHTCEGAGLCHPPHLYGQFSRRSHLGSYGLLGEHVPRHQRRKALGRKDVLL